jgi:hypothetical protein
MPPTSPTPSPDDHPAIPPRIYASPTDLPAAPSDALRPDYATMFDGDTPFWRPDAWDIARAIGWRWILLLPASILCLAFLVAPFFSFGLLRGNIAWEWKLAAVCFAASFTIVASAIKNVVKRRSDPFCIHCGYSLIGMGDHGQCPECGRPFVISVIEEFKKDPHFFQTRAKAVRTTPPSMTFAAGEGQTPNDGTS